MKPSVAFRPLVESLEDRFVLATKASLSGSTLQIIGDNTFNLVRVTQSDDPNNPQLIVKLDYDDEIYFDSSAITTINANLAGGNDKFDYYLDPDFNYRFPKTIIVDLGAGRRNEANFELDLLTSAAITADMSIRVTGGVGRDDVAVNVTSVRDANLSIRADLGNHDDFFLARFNGDPGNVVVNDPTSGDIAGNANVTIVANGGRGRDKLQIEMGHTEFSRSWNDPIWQPVVIGSNATFRATLNGDDDNDTFVGMRFRGVINGLLFFRGNGGAGVDQMLFSATTDDGFNPSTGSMDAVLNGGDGNDVLKLYFRNQRTHDDILNPNDIDSQMALVNLLIDGGAGRDGFWRGGNNIGRPFIKMINTEFVAPPPPVIY